MFLRTHFGAYSLGPHATEPLPLKWHITRVPHKKMCDQGEHPGVGHCQPGGRDIFDNFHRVTVYSLSMSPQGWVYSKSVSFVNLLLGALCVDGGQHYHHLPKRSSLLVRIILRRVVPSLLPNIPEKWSHPQGKAKVFQRLCFGQNAASRCWPAAELCLRCGIFGIISASGGFFSTIFPPASGHDHPLIAYSLQRTLIWALKPSCKANGFYLSLFYKWGNRGPFTWP